MRKSLLSLAILSALSIPAVSFAEDAPKTHSHPEEKGLPLVAAPTAETGSSWTVTSNIGFVSDYYFRGVSQTWHKPAVQGGFDLTHSSGFYAGAWGSNISPNTYPDANAELDLYAGYNGTISSVEGLGYTAGLYGYFYPGGSWKKYNYQGVANQTPQGGRWDTYEANVGLSYKWLSAKASFTLGDWFGAEKKTGFDGGTSGTSYIELNAAYPLPIGGLTLVGHVGHLNVTGKLDLTVSSSMNTANEDNPDYTDYKIGLSKSFTIAKSEGWNAGLYYVGASNGGNNGYWGPNGFGGSSFNGSFETRDLTDGRFVLTMGRAF